MKKFFTIFFVTLGVIFFLLLLAGVYFYIFDPLDLKEKFSTNSTRDEVNAPTTATQTDKNPLLSPSQEKTLETFGIDPSAVPSSITPEQEACFVSILGEARVAEIKAGDTPTAAEFFQAKSCIGL
jgi:hypothetical protein